MVPLALTMVMYAWERASSSPPSGARDALEVYVVGKQWMWKFQHAEGQREIDELHVPLGGRSAHDDLGGRDPQLLRPRLPGEAGRPAGRYTTTWFNATRQGPIISSARSTAARSTPA